MRACMERACRCAHTTHLHLTDHTDPCGGVLGQPTGRAGEISYTIVLVCSNSPQKHNSRRCRMRAMTLRPYGDLEGRSTRRRSRSAATIAR